jgi:hypothetical protein
VSWDFYFWKDSTEADPAKVVEQLADEEADSVVPDPAVLAFRSDLLQQWPDLVSRLEPWHTDLEGVTPWGRTDLADRFVILTLQWGWENQPELVALAHRHGLRCYDPQISQFA